MCALGAIGLFTKEREKFDVPDTVIDGIMKEHAAWKGSMEPAAPMEEA